MPTTTIPTTDGCMTLVNAFTVGPEHQQELLEALAEAGSVMAELDGLVSTDLHAGLDGRRVVDDVRWRSEEHFERMLADPRAQPHMQQAAGLAAFDPIRTVVAHIDHARQWSRDPRSTTTGPQGVERDVGGRTDLRRPPTVLGQPAVPSAGPKTRVQ